MDESEKTELEFKPGDEDLRALLATCSTNESHSQVATTEGADEGWRILGGIVLASMYKALGLTNPAPF